MHGTLSLCVRQLARHSTPLRSHDQDRYDYSGHDQDRHDYGGHDQDRHDYGGQLGNKLGQRKERKKSLVVEKKEQPEE